MKKGKKETAAERHRRMKFEWGAVLNERALKDIRLADSGLADK